MKKENYSSLDEYALGGLRREVSEDDITKIRNLIEKTKKEFESVFGKAKSGKKTVNGVVGISIDVWSDQKPDRQVVSISLNEREPIASGPKRRKPIRCGGEKCITIKIGDKTYRICVEWEGPCKTVAF